MEMDLPAKKLRLSSDTAASTSRSNTLLSICNWSNPEDIVIQHHDVNKCRINITYAQFAMEQLRIEQIIKDARTEQFVGIAADIPPHFVPILMLSVLSSRRAFVCLPSSTQEAQKICEMLNVSHIFASTNMGILEVAHQFMFDDRNICLSRRKNFFMDTSKATVIQSCHGMFAYATCTSGSTGIPKIVKVTHNSIVPNILDLKRILGASKKDKISQITPLTFDPSIVEIFLSLSCNGTLFTASHELRNDPKLLLKNIDESHVSILQSTPSLFLHRWSCGELRKTILRKHSYLRILLLGGETFPSSEIISKMKESENTTRIFDIYGITEVSCWATIREIEAYDSTRILGEALSETVLEVRTEEGKVVQEGEGILYVGSSSRICMLDDEDVICPKSQIFRETGDVAVIDEDRRITLKGRRGRRIKRYGTKVNLMDLENHVSQLSFVENCYALFLENNQALHLYFTTFNKNLNDEEKHQLETDVSSHTIKLSNIYRPDKIFLLTRFELTSNGKICRCFLKKHSTNISRIANRMKNKQCAAEIFANIWNRFFPSDGECGFLDLGGTSVMALRIANELTEELSLDFPEIIGKMLRNKNFNSCQTYVSENAFNYSNVLTNTADAEAQKSQYAINSSQDSRHTSFAKQLIDSKSMLTNSNDIVAWQKCRGRSNGPLLIEAAKHDPQNMVLNIRLEHLYCLHKCVDASPTVFGYSGNKSFVTVGSHSGIVCTAELTKGNLSEHWKIELPDRIEASVLVLNDFKGVVGSYNGYVYCFHLKSGQIYWKFRTGDSVKCTAVLSSQKQNIFFGSYDHYAYCVSLEKGLEIWKLKAGNGSISATPCVNDELNSVLFALLDGTCVSVKQDSGEMIWNQKLDYPVFSAPVNLNTGVSVFCDVSGKMTGFSAKTGEKKWIVEIKGTVFSHLVLHNDTANKFQSIILASNNKKIYKLECRSEEEMPVITMKKDVGTAIFSTPWTDGKIIVVVCTNGELKIIGFDDGEILNNFKLGGDVFSSPILHDDWILVGCRDNNLYVLCLFYVTVER